MTADRTCPRCRATLAADAPEGLCPACLLGRGAATAGAGALEPAALAEIFPQLEILALLGEGGMGAVYKARQRQLDRLVALKILAPKDPADPRFAERFAREARVLARLDHPSIVAIHEVGESHGLYYLVMEFVDGVNLRQLLEGRRLAPEQALAIVPKVCEALQFAHDHGVVHRDIKPENILIDRSGRVKIADFGLAKLIGEAAPDRTLTATDQVMGTFHYMAPEQMERPQEVDHRADIYSLGVVFYEMLTGELPVGRFEPPSRRVEVDVRLDEVVLRSLERRRERRYQQASEVKTRVETIAASSGGAARRSREQRWLRLRPRMRTALKLALELVIVLGLFGFLDYRYQYAGETAGGPDLAGRTSVRIGLLDPWLRCEILPERRVWDVKILSASFAFGAVAVWASVVLARIYRLERASRDAASSSTRGR